ncbi:MAG TPA: IspD/TarI family cytidylyltransferase [Gemmatimonadota bacterium]|nr:IspD/TarI family cytidylyltransferase [Gemmatimonadota bacterium]
MGGEPKQFRLLGGVPLMGWGTRALLDALAGPVVVVLPPGAMNEGEAALRTVLPVAGERLRLVAGGVRRRDSVRAGLEAVESAGTVLVHDAARPFASKALVERVARRAAAGRAVVPALPVRDTLKEVDGPRIVGTVDRERFVAAQTPQGFPRAALLEAHDADPADATDCAALCERHGIPVEWIAGEALNRKITDPEDWVWAEDLVAAGALRWR